MAPGSMLYGRGSGLESRAQAETKPKSTALSGTGNGILDERAARNIGAAKSHACIDGSLVSNGIRYIR